MSGGATRIQNLFEILIKNDDWLELILNLANHEDYIWLLIPTLDEAANLKNDIISSREGARGLFSISQHS